MDWATVHKAYALVLWELAGQPLELKIADSGGGLPPGVTKITLRRDEDYGLAVTFTATGGKMSDWWGKRDAKDNAWKTVTGFTIKADTTLHGEPDYLLEGCHLLGTSASHDVATGEVVASGRLQVWSIDWKPNPGEETDRVVEWYLNGPRGHFYWLDGTDRDVDTKLEVVRIEGSTDQKKFPNTHTSALHESSSDAFFLTGKKFRCVIYQGPKDLAPDWANPIGIEFRKEWGIPGEEERRKISEMAAFIFGTELLPVGHTEFAGEAIVRAKTTDMRVGPTKYVCEALQYSPFDWGHAFSNSDPYRAGMSNIVDNYLGKAEALGLDVALRYYWLASRSPVGYSFPLLASACEGLVMRWAKAEGGDKVTTVMDGEEFAALAKGPLEQLSKTFPAGAQEKLLEHLLRANNLTGNQQWKAALAGLGVSLSAAEAEALDKRHIFAHGKESQKLMASGRAFELERALRFLFMRLLLTVLQYAGAYVDHGPAQPTRRSMDAQKLPAEFA
jgi:hypothetical protein